MLQIPLLLAELMFDAYENTIDWYDETLDDAVAEVKVYLQSEPLLNESLIATEDNGATSACLVIYLRKQEATLIAYIMTAKRAKKMGKAKLLLRETIRRLCNTGHPKIFAGITDGNVPSENLFGSFGFQRMNT